MQSRRLDCGTPRGTYAWNADDGSDGLRQRRDLRTAIESPERNSATSTRDRWICLVYAIEFCVERLGNQWVRGCDSSRIPEHTGDFANVPRQYFECAIELGDSGIEGASSWPALWRQRRGQCVTC